MLNVTNKPFIVKAFYHFKMYVIARPPLTFGFIYTTLQATFMLSVVMLSVIIPNAIMRSVVAHKNVLEMLEKVH
jgi:hypothetical protein